MRISLIFVAVMLMVGLSVAEPAPVFYPEVAFMFQYGGDKSNVESTCTPWAIEDFGGGTNGSLLTATNLASGDHGVTGGATWTSTANTSALTYSNAVSMPGLSYTLCTGGSYTDTSTLVLADAGGSSGVGQIVEFNYPASVNTSVSSCVDWQTPLAQTSSAFGRIDMFYDYNSSDYITTQLTGSGTQISFNFEFSNAGEIGGALPAPTNTILTICHLFNQNGTHKQAIYDNNLVQLGSTITGAAAGNYAITYSGFGNGGPNAGPSGTDYYLANYRRCYAPSATCPFPLITPNTYTPTPTYVKLCTNGNAGSNDTVTCTFTPNSTNDWLYAFAWMGTGVTGPLNVPTGCGGTWTQVSAYTYFGHEAWFKVKANTTSSCTVTDTGVSGSDAAEISIFEIAGSSSGTVDASNAYYDSSSANPLNGPQIVIPTGNFNDLVLAAGFGRSPYGNISINSPFTEHNSSSTSSLGTGAATYGIYTNASSDNVVMGILAVAP